MQNLCDWLLKMSWQSRRKLVLKDIYFFCDDNFFVVFSFVDYQPHSYKQP